MASNFTPLNGCAGVPISLNTSSSTRGTLPVAPAGIVGNAIRVANTGVNYGALALGDSSVTSTTSYMMIAPGDDPVVLIQFAGSEGAPTHAAGISVAGPTTFQITLGIAS